MATKFDIFYVQSYNKMNVLHLHLSDTPAFPVELESQPNITYYGAYSEKETYTAKQLSG
jgi:hexosaminidase